MASSRPSSTSVNPTGKTATATATARPSSFSGNGSTSADLRRRAAPPSIGSRSNARLPSRASGSSSSTASRSASSSSSMASRPASSSSSTASSMASSSSSTRTTGPSSFDGPLVRRNLEYSVPARRASGSEEEAIQSIKSKYDVHLSIAREMAGCGESFTSLLNFLAAFVYIDASETYFGDSLGSMWRNLSADKEQIVMMINLLKEKIRNIREYQAFGLDAELSHFAAMMSSAEKREEESDDTAVFSRKEGRIGIKEVDDAIDCGMVMQTQVKWLSGSPECKSYCFQKIIGLEDAKSDIRNGFIYPLLYPNLYGKMAKGLLFYGMPGTGKTLLAKATISEAQRMSEGHFEILMFAPRGSELKGKYSGETEKRISAVFDCASKAACERERTLGSGKKVLSIIFIDEIDAIAAARGDNTGDTSGEIAANSVNALLQAMDGVKSKPNVVVMAATNYPWRLDSAVLRRFESQIYIRLPDEKSVRIMMFQVLKDLLHNTVSPSSPEAIALCPGGGGGTSLADREACSLSELQECNSGFDADIRYLENHLEEDADDKKFVWFDNPYAFRSISPKDINSIAKILTADVESGEIKKKFRVSGSDVDRFMKQVIRRSADEALSNGIFYKVTLQGQEYYVSTNSLSQVAWDSVENWHKTQVLHKEPSADNDDDMKYMSNYVVIPTASRNSHLNLTRQSLTYQSIRLSIPGDEKKHLIFMNVFTPNLKLSRVIGKLDSMMVGCFVLVEKNEGDGRFKQTETAPPDSNVGDVLFHYKLNTKNNVNIAASSGSKNETCSVSKLGGSSEFSILEYLFSVNDHENVPFSAAIKDNLDNPYQLKCEDPRETSNVSLNELYIRSKQLENNHQASKVVDLFITCSTKDVYNYFYNQHEKRKTSLFGTFIRFFSPLGYGKGSTDNDPSTKYAKDGSLSPALFSGEISTKQVFVYTGASFVVAPSLSSDVMDYLQKGEDNASEFKIDSTTSEYSIFDPRRYVSNISEKYPYELMHLTPMDAERSRDVASFQRDNLKYVNWGISYDAVAGLLKQGDFAPTFKQEDFDEFEEYSKDRVAFMKKKANEAEEKKKSAAS